VARRLVRGRTHSDRHGANVSRIPGFEYPQEDFDAFPMTLGRCLECVDLVRGRTRHSARRGVLTLLLLRNRTKEDKELLKEDRNPRCSCGKHAARSSSFDRGGGRVPLPPPRTCVRPFARRDREQVARLNAGEQQRGVHTAELTEERRNS